MCFFVKHVDEAFADNLALAFGVGHAGELAEKFLRGIHANHVETEALVVVKHVFKLVFAEHAVVHEYTGEIFAYRLV